MIWLIVGIIVIALLALVWDVVEFISDPEGFEERYQISQFKKRNKYNINHWKGKYR